MENKGEGMENNLNLNIKRGKLIELGNQGEGMENNLNLEGRKLIKLGNNGGNGKYFEV